MAGWYSLLQFSSVNDLVAVVKDDNKQWPAGTLRRRILVYHMGMPHGFLPPVYESRSLYGYRLITK